MKRVLRITGIGLVIGAVATILGVLFIRDQMSRHQRDLFSSRPLRRLAALGYVARRPPAVESVRLLRDYIAWEPQPLIRRRAEQVLERIERGVRAAPAPAPTGEAVG